VDVVSCVVVAVVVVVVSGLYPDVVVSMLVVVAERVDKKSQLAKASASRSDRMTISGFFMVYGLSFRSDTDNCIIKTSV